MRHLIARRAFADGAAPAGQIVHGLVGQDDPVVPVDDKHGIGRRIDDGAQEVSRPVNVGLGLLSPVDFRSESGCLGDKRMIDPSKEDRKEHEQHPPHAKADQGNNQHRPAERRVRVRHIAQDNQLTDSCTCDIFQFPRGDVVGLPGQRHLHIARHGIIVMTPADVFRQPFRHSREGLARDHGKRKLVPVGLPAKRTHPDRPVRAVEKILVDGNVDLNPKQMAQVFGDVFDFFAQLDVPDESPILVPRANDSQPDPAQRTQLQSVRRLPRLLGFDGRQPLDRVAVPIWSVHAQETDTVGPKKIKMRNPVLLTKTLKHC